MQTKIFIFALFILFKGNIFVMHKNKKSKDTALQVIDVFATKCVPDRILLM